MHCPSSSLDILRQRSPHCLHQSTTPCQYVPFCTTSSPDVGCVLPGPINPVTRRHKLLLGCSASTSSESHFCMPRRVANQPRPFFSTNDRLAALLRTGLRHVHEMHRCGSAATQRHRIHTARHRGRRAATAADEHRLTTIDSQRSSERFGQRTNERTNEKSIHVDDNHPI